MEHLGNGKVRCKTCGYIFPWNDSIVSCPLCCVKFDLPDVDHIQERASLVIEEERNCIVEPTFCKEDILTSDGPIVYRRINSLRRYNKAEFSGGIVIPEGVERIDTLALSRQGITYVHIPSTLREISDSAFQGSAYLEGIDFADQSNLLFIGNDAFQFALSLSSFDFPETLEFIGSKAFANSGLEVVKLPSSIRYVNHSAFSHCRYLKKVYISSGSLKSICGWTFQGCPSLEMVYIPETVTFIDANAFGCISYGESKFTIWGQSDSAAAVFAAKNGIRFSPVDDSDPILRTLFTQKPPKAQNPVAFGTGITNKDIENDLFANANSRLACESISLMDGTTHVAIGAFAGDTSLNKVSLPHSLREIGVGAFYGCSALDEINIPENVEVIRDFAFAGTAIKRIVIPPNLRRIAASAFEGCKELKEIIFLPGESTAALTDMNCAFPMNDKTIIIGEPEGIAQEISKIGSLREDEIVEYPFLPVSFSTGSNSDHYEYSALEGLSVESVLQKWNSDRVAKTVDRIMREALSNLD